LNCCVSFQSSSISQVQMQALVASSSVPHIQRKRMKKPLILWKPIINNLMFMMGHMDSLRQALNHILKLNSNIGVLMDALWEEISKFPFQYIIFIDTALH
jgi:hypothetical protein